MSGFMDQWIKEETVLKDRFGEIIRIYMDTEHGREYSGLRSFRFPESDAEYEAAKATVLDESELTAYFYDMVQRTEAECRVMSLLNENGNIVRYEEYSIEEDPYQFGWTVNIRVELLKPFLSYIHDNSLTVDDVIMLGIDISHALEGCHQYEIVHRNVCPETIYVTEDGHFKLGGFDIAHEREKVTSDRKQEKQNIYMSPEQYGGKNYSYPSDIYSLGLILYRFLNGDRLPFLPPAPAPVRYFDRQEAVRKMHEGLPFPDPVNGTSELSEIIKKACAFKPENRYNATMLREALMAYPIKIRNIYQFT